MVKLVHINKVGTSGDLYVVREFQPPVGPDNSLPAIPGVPDNTLPTTPPPQVPAGQYLIMIRTPDGKWKWATVPTLPPPLPDNALPGAPAMPGQGLPPTAQPKL